MQYTLGLYELSKSNKQTISLFSNFDDFCSFFDADAVFRYNDLYVDALSSNKVIINDANTFIKVPLIDNRCVLLKFIKNRTYRIAISNPKQNWDSGSFLRPEIFNDGWVASLKSNAFTLPLRSQFYKSEATTITDVTFNSETTLLDVGRFSLVYPFSLEPFISRHKEVSISGFMFEGVPCCAECTFNENDFLRSVSLRPSYSNLEDSMLAQMENAQICKERILSLFGVPDTFYEENGRFSLSYNFGPVQLYTSLSFDPKDNYPQWRGITIAFNGVS